MPKAQEAALKRKASKMHLSGERADAFVYGSLRRSGWKPKRERRKKHLDLRGKSDRK